MAIYSRTCVQKPKFHLKLLCLLTSVMVLGMIYGGDLEKALGLEHLLVGAVQLHHPVLSSDFEMLESTASHNDERRSKRRRFKEKNDVSFADGESLLEFRRGTNAEKLGYLRDWNVKNLSSMCSWEFIICNIQSPRRVESVQISSFGQNLFPSGGLGGLLSPSLGNLTRLKTLSLAQNFFQGFIPEELGKIQDLEWLDLSDNLLTGQILSSVGNLSKLHTLSLDGNYLNGSIPFELGKLCRLIGIDLTSNNLSGRIPISMRNCSQLQTLLLSSNSFTGLIPEFFENFSELIFLRLNQNHLSGHLPLSLSNCTGLYIVDLSHNNLEGELPNGLENLQILNELNLAYNSLSGSLPPSLGNISMIDRIFLRQNNLTGHVPASLGQLWGLRALDLSFNNLTGSVPGALANCSNLWFISLAYNMLQGQLPMGLFDLFSEDRIVAYGFSPGRILLEHNLITGQIPSSVTNCSRLGVLVLSNNQLTGDLAMPGTSGLGMYPDLRVFDAGDNYLQGKLPIHIGNLTQLLFFNVGNNQLQGSIPSSMELCDQLLVLDLSENEFSGPLPRLKFQKMIVFSTRSNHFDGSLPIWLWNLTSLKILDLSDNEFVGNVPSDLSGLRGFRNVTSEVFYLKLDPSDNQVPLYIDLPVQLVLKGYAFMFHYILARSGSINLSHNNLDGKISRGFVQLLALHSLNLSHNHFTGEIQEDLGTLRNLEALDLSNNNLSGRLPSSLTTLSLAVLNLSFNDLTGPIPAVNSFDTRYDCSSFFPGNPGLHFTDRNIRCNNQKVDNGTDSTTSNPGLESGRVRAWWKDLCTFPAFVIGFAAGSGLMIAMLFFSRRVRRVVYFYKLPSSSRVCCFVRCVSTRPAATYQIVDLH